MAAAICFRSARVSLRLTADNGVHLPVQIHLLYRKQVEIIRFVQSALWALKTALYNVLQHNFQRLTVMLIHGQQEEGHHEKNHAQRCGAGAQHAAGEKEKRRTHQRAETEADQLPLRQSESDFCFDLR